MLDSRDPVDRERPAGDGSAESPAFERFLRVYFTDSTLWPVLFVMIATLVVLGASLVLLALRSRSALAMAALAILAWASPDGIHSDRRRGGFGIASGLILSLWIGVGLVAFAAVQLGLF